MVALTLVSEPAVAAPMQCFAASETAPRQLYASTIFEGDGAWLEDMSASFAYDLRRAPAAPALGAYGCMRVQHPVFLLWLRLLLAGTPGRAVAQYQTSWEPQRRHVEPIGLGAFADPDRLPPLILPGAKPGPRENRWFPTPEMALK